MNIYRHIYLVFGWKAKEKGKQNKKNEDSRVYGEKFHDAGWRRVVDREINVRRSS